MLAHNLPPYCMVSFLSHETKLHREGPRSLKITAKLRLSWQLHCVSSVSALSKTSVGLSQPPVPERG